MGRAIEIGREDLTAVELREAASREKEGAAARRMLAVALVLEGTDRANGVRTCGMTVKFWRRSVTAVCPCARNIPKAVLCRRKQKNFAETLPALIPEMARGKPLEIWFQDEARVGQQGTCT